MSSLTIPPLTPAATEAPHVVLATCSLCLSVWDGGTWIGAEQAIQTLRTYTHPEPPRLLSGLCDDCRSHIAERRTTRKAA